MFDGGLERHVSLTSQEREVLALVGDGETDAAIASLLGVSLAAVHSRLHRFYERTELRGRRAVAWAAKHEACCILSEKQ